MFGIIQKRGNKRKTENHENKYTGSPDCKLEAHWYRESSPINISIFLAMRYLGFLQTDRRIFQVSLQPATKSKLND